MAVSSCLLIDWTQQIKHLDNAARAQIKVIMDQGCNLLVRDHAGTLGIDRHIHRLGNTNGISHLDLALPCEARRHDVLGHVARSVGGRAVHFCWIFAAEGAATVRTGAAIGIHNDLATGQATVALRAANDKAPGRVDQVLGVWSQPFLGQYRLDDFFTHGFVKSIGHALAQAHLGCVLA